MIGTSQLINAFGAPVCFTDTTDIFKDGSGVALYGLDYDASDAGGTSGKFGEAAIFNGSSSRISLPSGSFQNTILSVSAWINVSNTSSTRTIIETYGYSGSSKGWLFRLISGKLQFDGYNGDPASTVLTSNESIPLNTWTHVAVVFSANTTGKLYINGSEVTYATQTVGTVGYISNEAVNIGALQGTGVSAQDYFIGSIDQVRIYNTALTQSQVTQLSQENSSTVGTHLFGCIANYNLDGSAKESMGTTAYDGVETDITYRYDGTPTNVDFGVGGKSNYGAGFNGSSSIIKDVLSGFTYDNKNITFSAWIKSSKTTQGNNVIIGQGISNADGGWGIATGYAAAQKLSFSIAKPGVQSVIGSVTMNTGNWQHVVVVVDFANIGSGGTSAVKMYVDGTEDTGLTGNLTQNFDESSFNTAIGGTFAGSNGRFFDGDIDQVRIFNKALNQTEVDTLYAETACVYTATTTDNNYPTTNAAYYKLDNSPEDSHGNTYDGVETDIEYRFGRFGQAAVLNGSSSLMTITDGGIGANGTARVSFSVSLWIKTTASNQSAIISDFGSNYGFYIQMESSASGGAGKLSIANFYTGGLVYTTAGTAAINDGNWHHLVLVNDTSDNTQKLYLDGNTTAAIDQTLGTGTKTANAIQVGYYTGYVGTYNFDGSIDQTRLFSSALSNSQVTQLYNEKPEVDTSNFKAVLYEGNGGTNFVSNVGFEPDLVWVKARDDAHDHVLYDTVRGVGSGKALSSNANYTEGAYDAVYGFLDTFEATGFVAKTGSSVANYTNKNNESYVAWNWKGSNADAVSNTDGTNITSTVSANQDAGFSIVEYTATNNASNSAGHGLTSPPEIIIQKRTNSAASDWYVITDAIDGSVDYLRLNTTAAKADMSGIYSNFTLGSSTFSDWWGSGHTIINYCWHSVAGYSKIGVYTGDGTTSKTVSDPSFEPSFVMIKRTDNTSNWRLYDNIRGTNVELYANSSSQDVSATGYINFNSNGFELTTSGGWLNELNGTYIYMAFK